MIPAPLEIRGVIDSMGCVLPDNNESFHPALPYQKEVGAKKLARLPPGH